MTAVATGVGSWPGEDFAEALRIVLGELPDLPHLPELPARGAIAGLTGRGAATITELGFDLQPAGWRLTDATGVDQRRARSLLQQDLDALEEQTQGFTGELKVQLVGPWTLAATVEKPRGDKVLADHGARRDLGQALAEGVRDHVAEVRRRVPGAEVLLQLDEPLLPSVLAGKVPTASGFGRHRSVDRPEASQLLEAVIGAADCPVVVHSCAADPPLGLLRGAGAAGLSLDLGVLAAGQYDDLARALEDGDRVLLGVVPTVAEHAPTARAATERALRLLDMLGLGPDEVGDQLVLTPACGLAGATPDRARAALTACREAAAALS
jgi:methionine synthase II (cobalamin-independent)